MGYNTIWRGMAATGWALKRQEAYAMYENDFTFRAMAANTARFGTIFRIFNTSLNVPQRAVNVYKARAAESLVNTSPFTGFMPEGDDDNAAAIKLAERVFHAKLEESESRFHFREAITQAALSEAVMKTSLIPRQEEAYLDDDAQYYVNAFGEPIRDERGGYVFLDEELDYHPDVLDTRVLKRDPTVVFDGTEQLTEPAPMIREGRTTLELSIRPTGWENFFCSPLEPDIHTADCIFHEFDEEYDIMARRAAGLKMSKPAKQWLETMKNSAQRYPMTEGAQPRFNRGERDVEMFGPVRIQVCEMWLRFDVYDRGVADEVCVTWAVGGNGAEAWPIYYDTMKNASPTGKRPFDVIRVIPVKDRWYGFGFYDLLSNDHEFIDDAWNRIRVRSSASGRLDWIKRDSFEGIEYGRPGSLSNGMVYVLKSDKTGPIGEHMGSIAFPELDDKIWEMLKMALQIAQLRSGTMTPGDAAASDLPANNTATGQDLLANESELMSNDTTQDVIRGIVATLKQAIVAIFDTPDQQSKDLLKEYVNTLLGVEDGAKLLEWLKTAKPKAFAAHVKLLLTKARSKQALQAASQANQIVTGGLSWVQVATQLPQWVPVLMPLFKDMLTALDVSNVETILKVPDEILQLAVAQQAMTAQQSPVLPVKQTGTDQIGKLPAAQ